MQTAMSFELLIMGILSQQVAHPEEHRSHPSRFEYKKPVDC